MVATHAKRLGTVSAAIALISLLSTSGGAAAHAQDEIAYDAVGEATGIEVTISNPTIPAGIVIQGSGPTAQARLSSLGTSDAFAALPYPGDTAANLPGVVTALINVPIPAYPLYIHSENGGDPQSASYVGATLNAASTGNRSSAKATAGQDATGYFAESTIAQDSDGSVSVNSTAKQNGLDVGGLVTLSGVVTTAQALLDSSGTVTTKSALVVGRFNAPALKLRIPDAVCIPTQPCQMIPAPFAGIELANPDLGFDANGFYLILPIAGPQRFAIPTQAAVEAFKQLGVAMTYQKEIKTPTSIVAASLSLSTVLPSLPDNPGLNGPTPVTYTLGRAQASVSGQITPNDSSPGIDIPIGDGAGLPTEPSLPLGGGSAIAPVTGAAGLTPGLTGTVPPPTVEGPTGSHGTLPTPVLAASTRRPLHSIFWFYLVLVGVGLVGSVAGQVLRYVGVRSSWAS